MGKTIRHGIGMKAGAMNKSLPSYAPVGSKKISASEFLSLRERGMPNIESVEIAPPELGGKDFGGFIVKLKVPELAIEHE